MYYTVVGIVIASVIHVLYTLYMYVSLLLSPQNGQTPLYVAAIIGDTDVVRLLLENKADPNISNKVSYSIILFHQ